MAWNNIAAELLPAGVAQTIIESASVDSAVLKLANTIVMPEGTMSIPTVSVVPKAEFVALGGRKPLATIEWSAERLIPEEIAAVTYVPDAYIDDSGFPVWASVESELTKAVGQVLDAAVLFGTGAPASYPSGGVAGAGAPQISDADPLAAISAGMAAVEADGLIPNGIASSPAIGAAMRTAWQNVRALPSERPASELWGVPVAVTPVWDATKGDAIVGDWTKLVVGIRADIGFDLSTDGVLLDDAGVIQVSAFQDDVTLIRVHMRVAAAIGTPVQADGTSADPFQTVRWTGVTPPP